METAGPGLGSQLCHVEFGDLGQPMTLQALDLLSLSLLIYEMGLFLGGVKD